MRKEKEETESKGGGGKDRVTAGEKMNERKERERNGENSY